MRVDSLEEAERDPDVDGEDVQVAREEAVEQGSRDGAGAKDHDLCRVRILSGQTERRRVLVMDFVNVLVEHRRVEELMGCRLTNSMVSHGKHSEEKSVKEHMLTEIVEHVLEEEKERQLGEHDLPMRERHLPGAHAKDLSDRMEQEDLSKSQLYENLKGKGKICSRWELQS